MQYDVQNKREVPLGDMDPYNLYDEEKYADDKIPRNTVTVEMAGEGNENSGM